MKTPRLTVAEAARFVGEGKVIAYPTEGVYGLGCDPFDPAAVARVRGLKNRPADKPMILIAASFEQVAPLLGPTDPEALARAQSTWPGPHTWIFPASKATPRWLTGPDATIAVRVTAHPVVTQLCEAAERPLISTSANRSAGAPLATAEAILEEFGASIAGVVAGDLGNQSGPTPVTDARSNQTLRSG